MKFAAARLDERQNDEELKKDTEKPRSALWQQPKEARSSGLTSLLKGAPEQNPFQVWRRNLGVAWVKKRLSICTVDVQEFWRNEELIAPCADIIGVLNSENEPRRWPRKSCTEAVSQRDGVYLKAINGKSTERAQTIAKYLEMKH